MRFLVVIVLIGVVVILLKTLRAKKNKIPVIPANKEHDLLQKHVRFYAAMNPEDQHIFRKRVMQFLGTVTISPVGNVAITDLDRLYVAASAIIPIASFKDWTYNNLNEVLIYPDAFTKDFSGAAEEKNVLGMVGNGAMHRMMILTLGALRAGFENETVHNTGVHEFVHLLDKADGATDGIPEAMLPTEFRKPWMEYMHRAINEIRQGESDIEDYGGTNEAEFFAVISEYFFQKPDQLKEQHPKIWALLERIYGKA